MAQKNKTELPLQEPEKQASTLPEAEVTDTAPEAENQETAMDKLQKLLNCGNDRVELSAAKVILAMEEADASLKAKETEHDIRLEVEIKIVE